MYVTQEQLHQELEETESRLTLQIECVQSELRDFKVDICSDVRVALAEQEQRFDHKLADWLSVIRTDIENFRIIIFQEMRKESELQRFYFQQHMEEVMVKQREQFNADITRHMTALGEEYQWRLSATGEKVDLIWEKCERKYVELEQKDMLLAEKVALLEEYLPTYPRNHKGFAQLGRKSERLKSKQVKGDKRNIKKKPYSNK
jgi:hypothetical protein